MSISQLCNTISIAKRSFIDGIYKPLVSDILSWETVYIIFFFQSEQIGYFCDDNSSFGDSEAQVFCKMLGWPMGKKVPFLSSLEKDMVGKTHIFSTVSCQGDELHIQDCDNNIISKVTSN